jgi:excisionase family DNA binding protein
MQTYTKVGVYMNETKYYTTGQVANILGVHKDTVRRWENTGKIRSIRMEGGWRRFPESELEKLLGEE